MIQNIALRASLLLAILAAACAGVSRRDGPRDWYSEAVPLGFPSTVRIASDTPRTFENRAPRVLKQVHEAAGSDPISILALSGGGGGSAFGAGALIGWSAHGTRPQFQIVTGVSAGSLIAPFAFLGTAWDARLTEIFSGERTQHLLQSHWISALFGDSIYRGEPLAELADQYVTPDLIRAVAAEAAKGRLLLVATTDLDKMRTVIWNLGVIAAQGGENARRLFRDVIVASASIHGVYTPVIIRVADAGTEYDEMHVDGGTTTALFIAPEIASLMPVDANPLRGANVYLIVNGQFGAQARTTPVRTLPILSRSITAALQSSSRAGVEVALSLAQRDDMNLLLTEIPNDYPFTGPLDLARVKMKALFDFGARCAQENKLWTTPREMLDRIELAYKTPNNATPECPAPH